MSAEQPSSLACADLPLAVVDKYWFADGNKEPFLLATAKAVCGNCAVQLACLTEAIENPVSHGVRGGEAPGRIHKLHNYALNSGIPPRAVALAAIWRQLDNPYAAPQVMTRLRAGHFPDNVPLSAQEAA